MRTLIRYLARIANAGQCSVCGGIFDDWDGGICDACAALGPH